MNVNQAIADLTHLSIDDRRRVVHAIWDSLPDDIDLSPNADQHALLNRRLEELRADPSAVISHDELLRRVESRR